MIKLNNIAAHPGATKKRKRLGRGWGSGHGTSSTKGDKGQKARKSGQVNAWFEGGQTPLYRRLPKKGFKNFFRKKTVVINLRDLELLNPADYPVINLESLRSKKQIRGRHDRLAILGDGEITKAFVVQAHKVSIKAQEKLQKAGGRFEILEDKAAQA